MPEDPARAAFLRLLDQSGGVKPKMLPVKPPMILPPLEPTPEGKSLHPEGLPEGLLERAIKYFGRGGDFNPSDEPYLEQYLHPDFDILPKQPNRPTGLSKVPEMEFRRVQELPPLASYDDPEKPLRRPNTMGLGRSLRSLGPDYNSIYDVWDFDTPSQLTHGGGPLADLQEFLAKKIMGLAGTPYAVYERYPKGEELHGAHFQAYKKKEK